MKIAANERLRLALRPYPPGERYLIGVSGGRDSIALLHMLLEAGYRRLTVCHLDHGLRGKTARADARWVERLALRADVGFIGERTNVTVLAHEAGLSLETAARTARQHFFFSAAARTRCRTIFLAHHADDQVETFLFNLFRGTGTRGLGGMRRETLLAPPPGSQAKTPLRIVRPLLCVWRGEIDAYMQARRLSFREDATNADPAHTRNRLRAEIIPALETAFGRPIRQAVWRAADLLSAEDDWLTSLTLENGPLPAQLLVRSLQLQPVARQRRTVRAWLAAQGAPGIGYDEIEAVRSLLSVAAGPAKVNLPGGWHARRRAGNIFLQPVTSPGVSRTKR